MRLLVVEDDQLLAESLRADFSEHGYAVDLADNGLDAEHLASEIPYDAVILDLGLPERPGLEVLQNWRAAGNKVPVLVLTARGDWHERVEGFKAGADDYLPKPFHIEELRVRTQALIRRSCDLPFHTLEAAGLVLDEERQQVGLPDGSQRKLTGTEFRLLRYLMMNPDRVLSKASLTEHIWDDEHEHDSNLLEVYVRRLREKIGAERILTRRGQGYVFVTET